MVSLRLYPSAPSLLPSSPVVRCTSLAPHDLAPVVRRTPSATCAIAPSTIRRLSPHTLRAPPTLKNPSPITGDLSRGFLLASLSLIHHRQQGSWVSLGVPLINPLQTVRRRGNPSLVISILMFVFSIFLIN